MTLDADGRGGIDGDRTTKRRASYSPELQTPSTPSQKRRKSNSEITLPAPCIISIDNVRTYQQRKPVGVQMPVQLASFSQDEQRALHHDDRSRRYYHAPPHRADLNRGFERRVERDETINEHLDALLDSLMQQQQQQQQRQGKSREQYASQEHIVTWRGMMTKLCTLLYEQRQGFEMNVMLVGQTMYIEEHVGKARKADKARQANDERQKRFGYYGYSFESYCCHSRPSLPLPSEGGMDGWDGDVNTNVQWCAVVKTKLDDVRLIIGGEVDAVDPRMPSELIEVKTSMHIRNAVDEQRFETKLLRFYMQSFLLGVRRIVVGFRDARGVLITHQEFDTMSLPRAVRGKAHGWDPFACFAVAVDVLRSARRYAEQYTTFTQDTLPALPQVEQSDKYPVFRITFDPTSDAAKQVAISQLSPEEVLAIKGGVDNGRVGFLPSSYYTFVRDTNLASAQDTQ